MKSKRALVKEYKEIQENILRRMRDKRRERSKGNEERGVGRGMGRKRNGRG